MYHHLRGTLERKTPASAVLDVGGVGYELAIPLGTYERLPAIGAPATLLVTLAVREDSMRLYGFADADERAFFAMLQTVSGVGPQLALGIVSALPYREFRSALVDGDAARLRRVKGVGKRLSERLIVELKDRVGAITAGSDAPTGASSSERDAVLALEALGHDRTNAAKAVAKAAGAGDASLDAGELVRRALQVL